jgi:putative redox protein
MSTFIDIKYEGDLSTTCIHKPSKTQLHTDAPPDNNGKGRYFSPTDLLATALGTCMITVAGITAKAHQIHIGEPLLEVEKIMASEPRRVGEVKVKITFKEVLNEKERLIIQRAALNCPVAKSLHPDLKQEVEFVFA